MIVTFCSRSPYQFGLVNRPTTNRHLVDGWPADRSTGPTKISRQTKPERPDLSDADYVANQYLVSSTVSLDLASGFVDG